MRLYSRYCEFVFLPSFERTARALLSDEEIRAVQAELAENPRAGAVMRGTGGVRKIRVALPGGGKSGGARVIYYYIERKERIYLLFAYPKNEKANLSDAEKRSARRLVAILEEED